MNWFVQNNKCSQIAQAIDNFLAKAIILAYTIPNEQYGDFYSDCIIICISCAGLYCPYDFASSFDGTDLTILVNLAPVKTNDAYKQFASASQMPAANASITTTNATNKAATDIAKAVDSMAASFEKQSFEKRNIELM